MSFASRILYVHNSADYYGASRSLLRLIDCLDKNKFEPFVVLPENGRLVELLEKRGIKVIILPRLTVISRYLKTPGAVLQFMLNFPRAVAQLYGLIKKNNITLVHTNTAVIPASALAARIAGVPHIWHVREFFSEFKKLWFFYRRYMLAFSTCVVAVSRAAAEQFGSNVKVCVVHNGFDINVFKVDRQRLGDEFRRKHGLAGKFVVGCVGRIKFQRKGQDIFLKALALMKERGRSVAGLVVGAPYHANEGELDRLQNLARDLGIERDIVMTGEVEDTRPAYAAMDVSVLPSALPEPFGGVVLESMGMKLPVVATNIGGTPEQIENGVTGYLVKPGDAQELAAALIRLQDDPALAKTMGEVGYERLSRFFDWQQTTKVIAQLYEDLNVKNK
jgi:glycosyltransferase involved in cell wall biosynthesis